MKRRENGLAGVSFKRFFIGATASAAIWAGTWIGVGYLIASATWSDGGPGIPVFAVIVAASVIGSLSVLIRPAARAIIATGRTLGATAPAVDANRRADHVRRQEDVGMSQYALEILVRDRLADMRERGEQSRRILATRPDRHPLRFALGHALIWMGHRLQGVLGASRTPTRADGAVESRRISTHGGVRG